MLFFHICILVMSEAFHKCIFLGVMAQTPLCIISSSQQSGHKRGQLCEIVSPRCHGAARRFKFSTTVNIAY